MTEHETMDVMAAVGMIADWIHESKRMVVFTGAGVSTESGIPDFRSPGGIWEKYDPRELTYQKFLADPEVRKIRWKMFMESESIWNAKPNQAHLCCGKLYRLGKLRAIITQNIDGLHQEGGVPGDKVIEIHGTNREVYCLDCDKRWPSPEIRDLIRRENLEIPECDQCGGILKTATISFGQAMPEDKVRESERLSQESDLMLVMGSTLVVQPAALMPQIAKQAGARVAIINLSESGGDHYADLLVAAKAGEVMSLVMEEYKERFTDAKM